MTQTRVTPGTFKRLTAGPGQFALAIGACLLLVLAVFLITPGGHDTDELRPQIGYTWEVKALTRAAPYQVYAPEGLPTDWRANSSRLTGTDASKYPVTDKPVGWHLGFATPSGQYAALEQSNETGDFVRRMTNVPDPSGSVVINGLNWEKFYQKDKKQYSLVTRQPASTLIVTGTADFTELATLAGSLKPQSRT
jgi:hypothetical protein